MVPVAVKQQLFLKENARNLHEYLLVVRPDAAVHEKIMAEKQKFCKDYKMEMQVAIKPHITVTNFLAREEMEETLIRWIQRICSRQKGFRVTLNNYSGFPPHTIYLRIQDPEPFQLLARQLKVIDDFISTPASCINKLHLGFAGKMPEQVYEKAMFDYSQKIFHEFFSANEMILLKKDHQSNTCKTLNVFRFLPVNKVA
jgi:2'-5' RNA ligase superfamily